MLKRAVSIKMIIIFLGVFYSARSNAGGLQIPIKCFAEQGKKERNWDCATYNSKDPGHKNQSNVCRFEDGRWTQGSLSWNKKSGKYVYKVARTCTAGVDVKTLDENNSVRGPRANRQDPEIFKPFLGKNGKGFVSYGYREETNESGEVVVLSGGTSKPGDSGDLALISSEVPVACYSQFGGAGSISSNPLPCTSEDTNAVNYCELREFNTPWSGYQGWWWVHYSGKNKTSMRICNGGVQTIKLTENQLEDGALVTGKQKTQIRDVNYRWDTETSPEIKQGTVIGCYLAKDKSGSPIKYKGCSISCKLGDNCSNRYYPIDKPIITPSDSLGIKDYLTAELTKPFNWREKIKSGQCYRDADLGGYKKNYDYNSPGLTAKTPFWKWGNSKCAGGIVIAEPTLDGELAGPLEDSELAPGSDRLFKSYDNDSIGFGPEGKDRSLRVSATGVGINTAPVPSAALSVNGNIVATTVLASGGVSSSSDARLKQLISPIQGALQKILELRGVTYYWKKKVIQEKQLHDSRQIGLIAQEVEPILPEVVTTDSNGMKSIAYSNLTAVLIEALKDQQRQIEHLRTDRDQLEKRMQELEKKVQSP